MGSAHDPITCPTGRIDAYQRVDLSDGTIVQVGICRDCRQVIGRRYVITGPGTGPWTVLGQEVEVDQRVIVERHLATIQQLEELRHNAKLYVEENDVEGRWLDASGAWVDWEAEAEAREAEATLQAYRLVLDLLQPEEVV